jgi:hypothetical protein
MLGPNFSKLFALFLQTLEMGSHPKGAMDTKKEIEKSLSHEALESKKLNRAWHWLRFLGRSSSAAVVAALAPRNAFVPFCVGIVFAFLPCVAKAQDDKPETPIAVVTAGWTYLWADQGSGERSNLNGWFARPAVTIGKGYSGFADFTNYYGANHKGAINSHGFTFGVSKNVFTRIRFKPVIFAEAGDVRSSNAGAIVNQFAFATGASFSVPLRKWVSLAITPAEYIFLYPKGEIRNDFNSKVGLSFPIGHR